MGTMFLLSTYLGGTGNDVANGIALDPTGSIYLAGATDGNFPTTAGVVQQFYGGAPSTTDAFVAKLFFRNAAPTINGIMNQTVAANSGAHTVNLTGISQGTNDINQTITVTASSNNLTLIPNPTVTYTSPNSTGTLTFTPMRARVAWRRSPSPCRMTAVPLMAGSIPPPSCSRLT